MTKALIAFIFLVAFAGPAGAVGTLAEITIFDRAENRVLPVYQHEGRYYVAGRPGNEYTINVRNRQSGDILTVVSVDGVNAISGETANWSQTGYVLGSYMNYGIKGWRKNLQRTAAFFFTELDNSYAARTGRANDVGVIGVAVFRRKAEPPPGISRHDEKRRAFDNEDRSASEAQPAAKDEIAQGASRVMPAPPASPKLGTGHGQSETSVVRYTNFERASTNPDEVIAIYYDSYRNLVAQGVIRDYPRYARPSPFPGQFVPDPR